MNGQDGNRGYLVQALIAVLRSLSDMSWISVAIEPNNTSEKVDIRWETDSQVRVVQVKSSRNQISKAQVTTWATELKQSCTADEYRLILVGPVSQSVIKMGSCNGVVIPSPKNLDLAGLLNEAAHLLGRFLTNESIPEHTSQHRELMVAALITELSHLSTTGSVLNRKQLVDMLKVWVRSIEDPSEEPAQISLFDEYQLSQYAKDLVNTYNTFRLISQDPLPIDSAAPVIVTKSTYQEDGASLGEAIKSSRRTFEESVADHPRAWLIGPSGSGKSLAFQKLVHDRAVSWLGKSNQDNSLDRNIPIPILLNCNSYRDNLLNTCLEVLRNHGVICNQDMIRREFRERKWLLVLDGLEQCTWARPSILSDLAELASAFPSLDILVTSYSVSKSDAEYLENLYISPLDREGIFSVFGLIVNEIDAADLYSSLQAQGIAAGVMTPLLASLYALGSQNHVNIGDKKIGQVYDSVLGEGMTHLWRPLKREGVDPSISTYVLCSLALEMYQNKSVQLNEVEVANWSKRLNTSQQDALLAIKSFEARGIITRIGGSITFAHLTYGAYYLAIWCKSNASMSFLRRMCSSPIGFMASRMLMSIGSDQQVNGLLKHLVNRAWWATWMLKIGPGEIPSETMGRALWCLGDTRRPYKKLSKKLVNAIEKRVLYYISLPGYMRIPCDDVDLHREGKTTLVCLLQRHKTDAANTYVQNILDLEKPGVTQSTVYSQRSRHEMLEGILRLAACGRHVSFTEAGRFGRMLLDLPAQATIIRLNKYLTEEEDDAISCLLYYLKSGVNSYSNSGDLSPEGKRVRDADVDVSGQWIHFTCELILRHPNKRISDLAIGFLRGGILFSSERACDILCNALKSTDGDVVVRAANALWYYSGAKNAKVVASLKRCLFSHGLQHAIKILHTLRWRYKKASRPFLIEFLKRFLTAEGLESEISEMYVAVKGSQDTAVLLTGFVNIDLDLVKAWCLEDLHVDSFPALYHLCKRIVLDGEFGTYVRREALIKIASNPDDVGIERVRLIETTLQDNDKLVAQKACTVCEDYLSIEELSLLKPTLEGVAQSGRDGPNHYARHALKKLEKAIASKS